MKGIRTYGMPTRKKLRKGGIAEELERNLKWRLGREFTAAFSKFTDRCLGRRTELGSDSLLLKHVIKYAFRGAYPDLKISYKQVVFIEKRAQKWYPYLTNYSSSMSEDGLLRLTWAFRDHHPRHYRQDFLVLYVYNEDTAEGKILGKIVHYELLEAEIDVVFYKPEFEYHFWIFEYQNTEAYGRSFYLSVSYSDR
jgi:hypothetical protein